MASPTASAPHTAIHVHRRLVERVSADEVTVDYANDLDTAESGCVLVF